jgi:hypothetical protein
MPSEKAWKEPGLDDEVADVAEGEDDDAVGDVGDVDCDLGDVEEESLRRSRAFSIQSSRDWNLVVCLSKSVWR